MRTEQAISKREGIDDSTPCYFGSATDVQKAVERHSQAIYVDFSPWIDEVRIYNTKVMNSHLLKWDHPLLSIWCLICLKSLDYDIYLFHKEEYCLE